MDWALECLAWIVQVKESDHGMPYMDSAGQRIGPWNALESAGQRIGPRMPLMDIEDWTLECLGKRRLNGSVHGMHVLNGTHHRSRTQPWNA
jgi:hypothetical protein